jgi:hypothetical protein
MVPSAESKMPDLTDMFLKVFQNGTSVVVSSPTVGMQQSARQMLITAMAQFVRRIMGLPRELRDPILQMTVPDHIDIGEAGSQFTAQRDPEFVLPLARLGSQNLRLECILAVLQNSMLKLTCLRDLNALRTWLASIDFTPLQSGLLQNGFDALCALGLSDINRAGALLHQGGHFRRRRIERRLFGRGPIGRPWPAPSSWNQELGLTRMCSNLRSVEVDVALSEGFLRTLQQGHSMVEAMKQQGRDTARTYQVYRLLKLKGLKVLRLRFFTATWNATTLSAGNRALIVSWLQEKFHMHGESVQVESSDW